MSVLTEIEVDLLILEINNPKMLLEDCIDQLLMEKRNNLEILRKQFEKLRLQVRELKCIKKEQKNDITRF